MKALKVYTLQHIDFEYAYTKLKMIYMLIKYYMYVFVDYVKKKGH